MHCNIISTGSQGNAVVINDMILIDCGVPFKALSSIYKSIKLLLLTHEHSDHFRITTIKRLSQERPLLRIAACAWLIPKLVEAGIKPSVIDVLIPGCKYSYGSVAVSPMLLHHDVPNVGYRIYCGTEKGFYATDTTDLNEISAKNYDLYMIEANYIKADIEQKIAEKHENGQYVYEYRKIRCHLSKEQADNWLFENMGSKSKYIYLHGNIDEV